jgi:glycosyltransferase involved in cell wall biosynthesis
MIESRLSVVITAYNSEAYIADAVQSVLNQSRAVDEIVVVDDGSTDSTRHVVADFADQGIKFIQQPNMGAGAARNKGIRETSGEFIAFLDADDMWLENKTRLQLEYLAAHPNAALVSGYAHWWNVNSDTAYVRDKMPQDMKALRRELLVHNVIGNPSMVMVRRSALEKVGLFNEGIRWGQDWELWQRLVHPYDAGLVTEPVTVYRWHQHNLSHVRKWERLLSYWNVSRSAIGQSQPVWRRPLLFARSWSNYTYRRAMYAMKFEHPRGRNFWYAIAALLMYPFEMTREKAAAVVRSITGDAMYRSAKQAVRSRLQAGGPE